MWSSVVKIISLIKLDQSRLVSDISQRQRLDMWCMKTMGKETMRLLLNKLTTVRSSSIFGVGNSRFSQMKKKCFGNIA